MMVRVVGMLLLLVFWCWMAVPMPRARADAGRNPAAYILEKCAQNDIVFLGTTHKQPAILALIAQLLPQLSRSGVTHLALEIATDQQTAIDVFLFGQGRCTDITLAAAIDCPDYRFLFKVLKDLPATERPAVRAIDLPPDRYAGDKNRDSWMAGELEKLLTKDGAVRIVVVLGSLHILRQLEWQDRGITGGPAIRTILGQWHPDIAMFSVVNIIGRPDSPGDFGRRLAGGTVAKAFDVDRRFTDWSLGLTRLVAIAPAQPWVLIDGVIIHSSFQ